MAQALQQVLDIVVSLTRSIADGDLLLRYQPQIEIASGALHGGEAVVRWQNPQLGLANPGDFIFVLEWRGEIARLG